MYPSNESSNARKYIRVNWRLNGAFSLETQLAYKNVIEMIDKITEINMGDILGDTWNKNLF